MKKIIVSISLLLLLMGCTPPIGQSPTSTTAPYILNDHPTITRPALLTPTIPAVPEDTATQTAEPTGTPIPSSTPDLAATVMATQQPKLYASYPSPDGLWRVDIITYDCTITSQSEEGGWNENAYEKLILVNLSNGEEHVADDQLQFCGGLGAFGFDGRYWAPDSRYFYYTTARQGVPDGCGYWMPILYRIEVNASAVPQYIGMGVRSTDEKQLASWNWPDKTLMIWAMDGGEAINFPALQANAEIGPLTWSPDSQSLVYLQVDSWCPLSGKSYLVLVDLSKNTQTLLLESASPTFGSVEWDAANTLSLRDENGKEWQFSILTHELTQNP